MNKTSRSRFDVLVIGGGPAGIAAAVRAAESGVRVGLVDDNPDLGGQIWRRDAENAPNQDAEPWLQSLRTSPITKLCGLRVFHQPEAGVLLAESRDDVCELEYEYLILATGARERFLPFPGWTLPNIMGAGGLQAMVKSGLPIEGKRVVVAGSGPLLLAVAAYLSKHGAQVAMICEQASWNRLARFGAALVAYPAKITQGLQLKRALASIPFAANSWAVAAHGREILESVMVCRAGKEETIPCDYLACGFHLVPNVELQQMLGCKMDGPYIRVDEFQQTTVAKIFCAGEPTGVGGVDLALAEGQVAGLAATGRTVEARRLFAERRKARCFAGLLDRTFSLRPELKTLASAETIVCRCEDVLYSHLQNHVSWRSAKLQTRCGMGACQGRICGPATQFLFNWKPDSVRPPIFPARVESLARLTPSSLTEQAAARGGPQ